MMETVQISNQAALSLLNTPPQILIFRWLRGFLKKLYLFVFRERGREGEREGEKHLCAREILVLFYALNQGPGSQPRHVP